MSTTSPTVEHIDEAGLESDIEYRFDYLARFCDFGEEDIAVIHGAADALAPIVPALVDAVYDKLFSYDATKRHFVTPQDGFDGAVPDSIEILDLTDDVIAFRKSHLARYLEALVTKPYDTKFVRYLDRVGAIHTIDAGNPGLIVPLVQMNALLTFVSSAIISTIGSLGLDHDAEIATMLAFNKLLWIQGDLISRHYVR